MQYKKMYMQEKIIIMLRTMHVRGVRMQQPSAGKQVVPVTLQWVIKKTTC